jgi:hypothetical protein
VSKFIRFILFGYCLLGKFIEKHWDACRNIAALLLPLLLYSYVRHVTVRRRAEFERAGVHQSLDERVHLQRDMRLTRMMLLCTWFQGSHKTH